jgi:Domain of unknown function (DUF4362)
MKFILTLALLHATGIAVFSQEIKPITPEQEKVRAGLEADKAFLNGGCTMFGGKAKTPDAQKARSLVFDALRKSANSIKIKSVCYTVEGDPMTNYLTIENGTGKLVSDGSRDNFGYKEFYVEECIRLVSGTYYYDRSKKRYIFTPFGKRKSLGDQTAYFQCTADDGLIYFL